MRRVVVILAALLCCTAAPPSHAMPVTPHAAGSCIGHWVGTGVQPGLPPWSIDMVITKTSGADCGTIEYPSLRCGGVLASCVSHGMRAHFFERYTHNPGTCSPAGEIDAVCHETTMGWVWTGEEVVGTTLHRQ